MGPCSVATCLLCKTTKTAPFAVVVVVVLLLLLVVLPATATTSVAPTFVSFSTRSRRHVAGRSSTTNNVKNDARSRNDNWTVTSLYSGISFANNNNNNNMMNQDATFVPPNVSEINDKDCQAAARRMQRVMVPVSTDVSPTGMVGISYIHWPSTKKDTTTTTTLPLLLVHGFDSSCLEYRRLGPKLAKLGIDTYAVDLLGWGFTQLVLEDGGEGDDNPKIDFSAQAKVQALAAFWKVVGKDKPVCVGGASLGGAAAIEYAAAAAATTTTTTMTATLDSKAQAMILLDAQGFVNGIGPMAQLPKPLARVGVEILKSVPLRSSANEMSYFDVQTFATQDALQIGRLHCLQEGWNDALMDFMASGGFSPTNDKIAACRESLDATLILWGRQDGILDGSKLVPKFQKELPQAQVQWIEECGHVPHLEKPEETAKAIATFLESMPQDKQSPSARLSSPVAVGTAAAVAAAAAATAVVANSAGF